MDVPDSTQPRGVKRPYPKEEDVRVRHMKHCHHICEISISLTNIPLSGSILRGPSACQSSRAPPTSARHQKHILSPYLQGSKVISSAFLFLLRIKILL